MILYLTTNPGKVREAREILIEQHGLEIHIQAPPFELPEVQADTCSKVAAFKARFAADRIGKPVLVSDSGLYVECLGGLPGPYNAQFEQQLGTQKFLELLQHQSNRSARLEHCFAYCTPDVDPVVFSGGSTGTLALEARGTLGRWHEKFYIPEGETLTLSELRALDPEREKAHWGRAIHDFAAWFGFP